MTEYCIYINTGEGKTYLSDWIVCDDTDHLVFRDREWAMVFPRFKSALKYRERMAAMNYYPHIEDASL